MWEGFFADHDHNANVLKIFHKRTPYNLEEEILV